MNISQTVRHFRYTVTAESLLVRVPLKGSCAFMRNLVVVTLATVAATSTSTVWASAVRATPDFKAKSSTASISIRGGVTGRYQVEEDVIAGAGVGADSSRSLSVFGQDERELDQYSAALAATHLLRKERDRVIKDTTNPLAYFYLSLTKPQQYNRWMSSPWMSEKGRRAQKNYLIQAGNIIRSNGLTTNRYNELSHILGKHKGLRERVQHQAYLYRVNVDVGGGKIQPLVDLAQTAPRLVQDKSQKVTMGMDQLSGPSSKNMMFAKSLKEIEALRHRTRRRLMNEIGCDELPPGLCRPSMGAIAPRVSRACRRFPVAAEHIVKANGLDPEEFNRLSSRSRTNLLYRWRILQCIRKLD